MISGHSQRRSVRFKAKIINLLWKNLISWRKNCTFQWMNYAFWWNMCKFYVQKKWQISNCIVGQKYEMGLCLVMYSRLRINSCAPQWWAGHSLLSPPPPPPIPSPTPPPPSSPSPPSPLSASGSASAQTLGWNLLVSVLSRPQNIAHRWEKSTKCVSS